MKKKLKLISTGLSIIDKSWGGFYRGGTYLLLGQRKTGRTLLGLQYASECVKQNEVCLYFTSMRPKDLMIQAASIDFDLQTAMDQNQTIVVRVSPPSDIYEGENQDDFLVEYLNDIVTVVEQYQPDRLVFDELTYFVGFEDINLLQQTFLQAMEKIEEQSVTSLFILAEPATPLAQMIVDAIAQHTTGVLYLQKRFNEEGEQLPGGKITITPNIGHTEGQFISNYYIEPYKGVVFNLENRPQFKNPFANEFYEEKQNKASIVKQKQSKYKPLTNVDIIPEKFSFTNLYDINEFKLILNNQIALYKSTGQPFVLVSLKLDPIAEQQKLITINQLQNAVRLSTEKKDKICIVHSNILVLITKGDEKSLNLLVTKLKNNLPNSDQNYIDLVMKYIYAYTYQVDDNIENADQLLNQLIEEKESL